MSEHETSADEVGRSDALERVTDNPAVVGIAWALVSVPLLYGVVETLIRVSRLFTE